MASATSWLEQVPTASVAGDFASGRFGLIRLGQSSGPSSIAEMVEGNVSRFQFCLLNSNLRAPRCEQRTSAFPGGSIVQLISQRAPTLPSMGDRSAATAALALGLAKPPKSSAVLGVYEPAAIGRSGFVNGSLVRPRVNGET
jgi:hypothetical protein